MELRRGRRHTLAGSLLLLGITHFLLAGLLAREDFVIDACGAEERLALQLQIKTLRASVCDGSDPAHACFNANFIVRISLLQGAVLLCLAGVVLSPWLRQFRSRLLSGSLAFWGILAVTGLSRALVPPRYFDFSPLTLWPIGAAFYAACLALLALLLYWGVCRCLLHRRAPVRNMALVLLLNLLVSGAHAAVFLLLAVCI